METVCLYVQLTVDWREWSLPLELELVYSPPPSPSRYTTHTLIHTLSCTHTIINITTIVHRTGHKLYCSTNSRLQATTTCSPNSTRTNCPYAIGAKKLRQRHIDKQTKIINDRKYILIFDNFRQKNSQIERRTRSKVYRWHDTKIIL